MITRSLWRYFRLRLKTFSEENQILILGIVLILLWHLVLGIVWFASIHLKTPRLEIFISNPEGSKLSVQQPVNPAFIVHSF
jgi:hypothetical protein